ncbi:MAG: bifunctional phosphoribosyl-AMP cyclohydrolase/phosphoribosyl-ATP diphosphatase HisIE [Lachnospiraceae bacterium]|nr:bifunctional phosphoribosyl-AMP cyclohydrolase/phosphoribosyl-ATP diphosphatase HisIE [Lachnospiraceae bacterium]
MKNRELLVPVCLKNGMLMNMTFDGKHVKAGGLIDMDAAEFAASCENRGADALLLFDLSGEDEEHDQSISLIKKISRATDLPLYGGGNIRRLEDVKKLIYAGCKRVFLNYAKPGNIDLTAEASARFGKDKLLACIKTADELSSVAESQSLLGGVVLLKADLLTNPEACFNISMRGTNGEAKSCDKSNLNEDTASTDDCDCFSQMDVYCASECFEHGSVSALLSDGRATGVFCPDFSQPAFDFMEAKHALREKGIAVNTYEASLSWGDIKTGSDGLLPVVVQDYRTLDVLMVAYMNQEAFDTTIRTGRMTYWSRSRQELWVKGMTSGHFQYVRELAIDCDNDTLLAKVVQIGAACHTGNRSCFYRSVLKKEYDSSNPMKVFEDVFAVIEDRKVHPKEGSYTNYLFDKGIDKILKKVGEEASEIIIAAKNPDSEEVVYEISDFLYHMMVLMSEKGLTWEDITGELAKR